MMPCPHCQDPAAHSIAMAPIFSFQRLAAANGVSFALFGRRGASVPERIERIEGGFWMKCLHTGLDYCVNLNGTFVPVMAPPLPALAPPPAPPLRVIPARKPPPQMDEDMVQAPGF